MNSISSDKGIRLVAHHLSRISQILKLLTREPEQPDGDRKYTALRWCGDDRNLTGIPDTRALPLSLLKGIGFQKQRLLENTRQFVEGFPANNALLWGARGMGKSSLIKSVHADLQGVGSLPLVLVEIFRSDIATLPTLFRQLHTWNARCIVFCDDLSFGASDDIYNSLKAALEGGIEGKPENILFYATSNRRHLMVRKSNESIDADSLHADDTIDEHISLADRFGLWIGFHRCSQVEYLAMVEGYAHHHDIREPLSIIYRQATQWAMLRGGRSGRVAHQFITHLMGKPKKGDPGDHEQDD